MARADKELWIEQVLQVPRSRFSEAAARPVAPTPPSETERVKGVIAHASELIALADDRYREVKAGASQAGFAGGVQDPGEKLRGY